MNEIEVSKVTEVLFKPGAVIVLPTDTVYGIVARATDIEAVNKLYKIKGRSGGKPGTLIGKDIDQFCQLGLTRRYLKAVEEFWPGAVSVIIPVKQELSYLTQGMLSLAVRIPDDDFLISLLTNSGPLLTTSANLPGKPPAVNINAAKEYLGDKPDAYFGTEDLTERLPSTVIRVLDDAVEVIRQGAVKIHR